MSNPWFSGCFFFWLPKLGCWRAYCHTGGSDCYIHVQLIEIYAHALKFQACKGEASIARLFDVQKGQSVVMEAGTWRRWYLLLQVVVAAAAAGLVVVVE